MSVETHHIAFRAAGDDEQEAWREHLLDLGHEVSQSWTANISRASTSERTMAC